MKTPLHFDGHGVNDANGDRIFKLSTKQWRDDQRGLEPEFIRLSNLFASAPELLEALEAMMNAFDIGQNASPTSAIGKARKALAKAKSNTF